jgi:predicted PhzF superfamily epimerase YddE/YHI9
MKTKLYQIDAFTDRLFHGNPAAVCPLDEWLPDQTMQLSKRRGWLRCRLAGDRVMIAGQAVKYLEGKIEI